MLSQQCFHCLENSQLRSGRYTKAACTTTHFVALGNRAEAWWVLAPQFFTEAETCHARLPLTYAAPDVCWLSTGHSSSLCSAVLSGSWSMGKQDFALRAILFPKGALQLQVSRVQNKAEWLMPCCLWKRPEQAREKPESLALHRKNVTAELLVSQGSYLRQGRCSSKFSKLCFPQPKEVT